MRRSNHQFVARGTEDDRTCPACDKPCRTSQGLMAHMSTARSCLWYRKGKNRVPLEHDMPEVTESAECNVSGTNDAMDEDEPYEDFHAFLDHGNLFRFELPAEAAGIVEEAGNDRGASVVPALDDDEDTRVEDVDTTAGRVIRMEPRIVDTWKAFFAEDSATEGSDDSEEDRMDVDIEEHEGGCAQERNPNGRWRPFASELDWRVANWIIREDVGQGSLNRFLSIPGVVEKLGLTFKDVRELFIKVDALPDRAAWKTTSLTFPDRIDEQHLVRYRDILEAIKALLGNPAHAKDVVYRPRRVFADRSRTKRIYSEMWTGLWWNAVQVQ
ncbi:uncharacterized protein B0H18DRAFT_887368 [Fomitopsis serialis]|uniref:uncharacterized protein n=1 Tax=Fomitopsis serialis TaxID=139415 RepID=UPI0020079F4B|nr:uncharacterized protein B0H18DRAFT_889161 [Neoantrodia serialis]XP_047886429.1 uncharacterized protein B0H18DRAFT_887368 [Neoantrodia serialis]KAH9912827.1 hypothetical protein B0H18DRAFT_889161 [Neoantrodia serialis]KAH9914240.1 hypothetical protein B0H18DRAFT_887368 [Neoantrodia serialis]